MTLSLDRSRWTKVNLGDVVLKAKAKVDPGDGSVSRYVAGEHMDTDELRISRWGEIGDGYLGPAFHSLFKAGQVLYGSRRTYLRKVALADFDGVCANTTFVLETRDHERLLPELLPFVMSTEAFHAHSIAESKGSVNPYVNWPDIAKYEFLLPPIEEQQRIAELLWAAEREYLAARQVEASVANLRRALVGQSMVGLYNDDSVPRPTVGSVGNLQLGKMLSSKSRPGPDDGVKYLANVNVRWRTLDLSELRTVALSDEEKLKYRLQDGDILICEGGEVGRCAIWRDEIEECYYQKALHRLRLPPGSILRPAFFVEYMAWAASSGNLTRHSAGTTFSHLTEVTLRSMPIPVPSVDRQDDLLAQLKTCDEAAELTVSRIEADVDLRSRILGEVLG